MITGQRYDSLRSAVQQHMSGLINFRIIFGITESTVITVSGYALAAGGICETLR